MLLPFVVRQLYIFSYDVFSNKTKSKCHSNFLFSCSFKANNSSVVSLKKNLLKWRWKKQNQVLWAFKKIEINYKKKTNIFYLLLWNSGILNQKSGKQQICIDNWRARISGKREKSVYRVEKLNKKINDSIRTRFK